MRERYSWYTQEYLEDQKQPEVEIGELRVEKVNKKFCVIYDPQTRHGAKLRGNKNLVLLDFGKFDQEFLLQGFGE